MKLKNWYAEYFESHEKWIIHGEVYGNPKFFDGSAIRTSAVKGAELAHGRLAVTTKNSVYELEEPCFFSNADTFRKFMTEFADEQAAEALVKRIETAREAVRCRVEEMPETKFLYAYSQRYVKGDGDDNLRVLEELSPMTVQIPPETLMLAIKHGGSNFAFGVFKDEAGSLHDIVRYVHSGMVQDSVLLFKRDDPLEIVARYFPNEGSIEFYNQLYALGDENPVRIVVLNTSAQTMEIEFVGKPCISCEGHSAVTNFMSADTVS